jgi:hypothetical protein
LNEAPDSPSGLSRAIGNARVDLNPHQVDAALFALRSPLATGAILADEVDAQRDQIIDEMTKNVGVIDEIRPLYIVQWTLR